MKFFIKSKKSIFITLTLLLVIVIYHYKHHHSSGLPDSEAIMVNAQWVKQGDISMEAQSVGTLVAANNVELTPEVSGRVAKIFVRDGSFVKEGTPLIQLDDAVTKAKADSAKAAFTYSSENYKRMVLLGKKGAISQQSIDQALADLKDKKANAEEADILAQKMLLTAPFDGVLGKIKSNLGEYVTVGQKLVSLTDTRHLRAEFNISEKYFGQLKIGQQVTLSTSAYPGKYFYGKVAYIAPTINTEDRTISIYADVPNEDFTLTSGLFVNVTLSLGTQKNALIIPAVSIVATIDGQQVYKIVNGKAVAVPIKLGQRTENSVQVTQGLSLHDLVIVAGQQKIKDGESVKVKI